MGSAVYRTPEGEAKVMAFYDRVLALWPVPHEEINVPTRHGRTFVIASGPASEPALVLLHGSASNAVSWVGDVAEYSRCFRVYAVDTIGEAGRSEPNRPSWRGPAFVEWLEDVLDGLHITQASVVGLSEGGWLALRLAARHPERGRRMVLLAPGGVAPARLSFLLRVLPLMLAGRKGGEAACRAVFGREKVDPEAIRFMVAIFDHFRPRFGSLPLLTDDELCRIAMPTLVIAGAKDSLLNSQKTVARLSALAPGAQALLLPDAGHVLVGLTTETIPFLIRA